MEKKYIGGFWKWFWIIMAGFVLVTIWYFLITFAMSFYYEKEGNQFYHKKKYAQAIDSYTLAIKYNDKEVRLYNSLGYTYYVDYKDDRAIEVFYNGLELDPEHTNINYNLGLLFYAQKKYEKSIKYYNKVLEITPNDTRLLYTIGTVYDTKNDFESSLKIYKQILKIDSKHPYVHNSLGNVYSSLNKNEKAKKFYLQHIAMFPNDYLGYTNLYELVLTENKVFDSELESAYVLQFNEDKNVFIAYAMLKILEGISKGKKVDISSWQNKYENIALGRWRFNKLDKWIDSFSEGAIKVDLKKAIEVFKAHKIEEK